MWQILGVNVRGGPEVPGAAAALGPALRSDAVSSDRVGRGPAHRRWAVVAAAVCAAQAATLAGFIVFYLYEIGLGASDDLGRAGMSVVLFLVFSVGLGAMARAWLRDLGWSRTPTIVWNLLLLPVAWSLAGGSQVAIATAVGVSAILAVIAAVAAGAEQATH